jgi:tetratricopeptide (TPR) repeat protein
LAHSGRHAEAVPKLEAIVRDNPRNLQALDDLGASLVALEDWPRAIEVLQARSARLPDRIVTHQRLVQSFEALGRPDQARQHTLRALELLVQVHERRGELELARRYRALYEAETGAGGR